VTGHLESETLHQLKNQLGVAVGFVDLLLDEAAPDDPHREDLLRVQDAMRKALALIPVIHAEMTGPRS
jgi:hypothetical protein